MMNMNMNMGVNNMNINQGMSNLNQIYIQISQLIAQAMININQIMTNMNQLMTNMNQMNQLINSVNCVQQNNDLNNMNFNLSTMNKFFDFKYLINIKFESERKIIVMQCNLNEKLKDVIQKYRIKSGDIYSKKFIYNNQILNLEQAVEENGIPNGGVIICLKTGEIQGGNWI